MKKYPVVILLLMVVIAQGCIQTTPTTTSTQTIHNEFIRMQVSDRVYVEIDPRLELLQILYRISDSSWYREHVDPKKIGITSEKYSYIKDVDEYFTQYRNMKAVKMVNEMISMGLTYDAIPEFAIHLDPVNFSKAVEWDDMLELRPFLDTKKLDEFASAIAEFANKTNFWEFYRDHEEFYNRTLGEFVEDNPGIPELVNIEEEFFGENASAWHIIPMTVFCCHGHGYYLRGKNGVVIYAFLGFRGLKNGIPVVPATAMGSSFLAHEFAHSFVNPAVDKYYGLFEPYESLFDPVSNKLKAMAYSDFKTMLHETFVRAFEVYYLNATGNEKAATLKLNSEKKTFYFIDKVYHAYVNDYMNHRDKYRTFEDFMPRLAEVIGEVYNETDGGKNVEVPLTVSDFLMALKDKGGIVAYDYGEHARKLAFWIYDRFKSMGLKVEIKPISELNGKDKERNLLLVMLSSNPLVQEIKGPMVINGTRVYSRKSKKYYSGSLRIFEVVRNPWSGDSLIFAIIATDDRALNNIHAYNDMTYSIRDSKDRLLEAG